MNVQTQKVLDYLESEELAGPLADQIGLDYDQALAEAKSQALSKAIDILRPTVEALLPNVDADGLIEELAEQLMPTGLG